MNILIRINLLYFLFWGCGCLFAQNATRQQLIENSAIDYLRVVDNHSALYYGNLQEGLPRATNHPYLNDAQYAKARLSYRNVIYPEELLRLDLNRNELIILSPDYRNIVLFPENVDFAELHGQHIIYFRRDSLPGSPSSGYYFQLHSGKCRILEKQSTALLIDSYHNFYYSLTTRYYLFHDDGYYIIRNQGGLLKVFKPYKKELKRFISANKLLYRNNPKEFLIRTVNEYEKLSSAL